MSDRGQIWTRTGGRSWSVIVDDGPERDFDDVLIEYLDPVFDFIKGGGKYTYCVCFEGGTVSCIDCASSRRARTVHELLPREIE